MVSTNAISSWSEWIKIIVSGLYLGVIFGYNVHCLYLHAHGIPISIPVFTSLFLVFTFLVELIDLVRLLLRFSPARVFRYIHISSQ